MRGILFATSVLLLSLGCQNQQIQQKKDAARRWNQARVQLIVKMARQQFQSGQTQKALNTVEGAVRTSPDYAPSHLLIGQIYLSLNQLEKARTHFNRCLKLQPENPEPLYNLGIISEKSDDYRQAFKYYSRALNIKPDHLPYVLAQAEILIAQNENQRALELISEQISKGRQETSLYVAAGSILRDMGRHTEAVLMFRDAKILSPDDPAVNEALAFSLYQANQPADALKQFRLIQQKMQPQSRSLPWSCYLAMGDCHLKLGQFHQAQRCFEKVSQQEPSHPGIWIRLAQTALGRSDLTRAGIYARKAIKLHPHDSDAQLVIGYIALKNKEYPQALNIFRRIIGREKNNTLAYCLLGQTYQAMGDFSQAAEYYARALHVQPEDALARKLMQEIEIIQVSNKNADQKH